MTSIGSSAGPRDATDAGASRRPPGRDGARAGGPSRSQGAGVGRAGAGYRAGTAPPAAFPDGATVRVSARTAFEPDALVDCGPRLHPDAIEIPNPMIVVEVLSEGTARRDHGVKLSGYFSLPSVAHHPHPRPRACIVIHHRRGQGGVDRDPHPDRRSVCASTRRASTSRWRNFSWTA